jgi:GT2 family glycosyltransferase
MSGHAPIQPGWTAIVVNYNGASYLDACLYALEATQPRPTEMIVVDNASTDDSLLELHAFPRVKLLAQSRNLGFAGGANAGLAATDTELVVVLNPDVEVQRDFGMRLIEAFEGDPKLGAAGALLFYPDGSHIQHAGGVVERPLMLTRHLGYGAETDPDTLVPADVDFVTGGALALRVPAARAVDCFDTTFSPVYYEDVDLCLRLRTAGWRVRLIPSLQGIHHEGATLGRSPAYYRHLHRNRIRFALKHLTAAEWRTMFVPAELDRLRHELATLTDGDAVLQSGVDAIEALLRGIHADEQWDTQTLFPIWPLRAGDIDIAYDLVDVRPAAQPAAQQRGSRLQRWFARWVTAWYVDEALDRQRHFNAAVVRALDAHDHQHRAQTAALLLIALDALGMLTYRHSAEATASPAE